MKKQKIINEPVLIEIGNNQYKIDLDCKSCSKNVIPFFFFFYFFLIIDFFYFVLVLF